MNQYGGQEHVCCKIGCNINDVGQQIDKIISCCDIIIYIEIPNYTYLEDWSIYHLYMGILV